MGELFGCARKGGPRLVVLEALRGFNSSNPHPCDWRKRKENLAREFPHAEFSELADGGDMILGPGMVESAESCDCRIMWLLAWLRKQEESSMACVSHKALLERFCLEHLGHAGLELTSRQLGNLE